MNKMFLTLFFVIFLSKVFAQEPVESVPFELFGEHIFVKLQVNDSEPLDFIFDTGDGLTVLNIEKARSLNMLSDAQAMKTSAGGTVTGALLKHQNIELGSVEIRDVELYETALDHLEVNIGRAIDGIIGYDILKNYVVRIDYNSMQFQLYENKGYKYAGDGKSFKLRLNSFIPYIPGSVTLANGEMLKGDFFVDTGAGTTVDFNTHFVNSNEMTDKIGKQYSYLVSSIGDAETVHYKGKAAIFQFGSFSFTGIPIGLSQAERGIQNNKKVAGIIGNELLKRFNMVLNYDQGRIFMEPNGLFESDFRIDAAGFDLRYGERMESILMHKIHEGSPAAANGISANAQLLEVDGKMASGYSLPELRNMFSNSTESVKIKILQDGEYLDVVLQLESLL